MEEECEAAGPGAEAKGSSPSSSPRPSDSPYPSGASDKDGDVDSLPDGDTHAHPSPSPSKTDKPRPSLNQASKAEEGQEARPASSSPSLAHRRESNGSDDLRAPEPSLSLSMSSTQRSLPPIQLKGTGPAPTSLRQQVNTLTHATTTHPRTSMDIHHIHASPRRVYTPRQHA